MRDIARVFLKLGFLGFGGPLATVSMMEDEVVQNLKWISAEEFTRSYALIKTLPGPVSTQMAIHLGRARAGLRGGIAAGLFFTLPSFFIVLALGIGLKILGEPTWKASFVNGMQISALAVILQGVYRLGAASLKKDSTLWIVAVAMAGVMFNSQLEPLFILFFGLMGIFLTVKFQKKYEAASLLLIYVCLKAAIFTFGTGLAIIPLLETDVVSKYHWINHRDFMEALALGQITPGPVVITVTWIGYKMLGFFGAVIATVAVFLPGFIAVLAVVPMIHKKWGNSPGMIGFYRFVIPAVIGSMIAVLLKLIRVTLHDAVDWSVLVSSLILIFWRRTPPWLLIPFFGFMNIWLAKLF